MAGQIVRQIKAIETVFCEAYKKCTWNLGSTNKGIWLNVRKVEHLDI